MEGVWWLPKTVIIRLSQPSLAAVGTWAELGKNRFDKSDKPKGPTPAHMIKSY